MSSLIPHNSLRLLCGLLAGLLVWTGGSSFCAAATVRLRSSIVAESSILKLGDVADVFDDDADFVESLNAITLQPAPAPGLHLRLNLDVIRDRMRAHGVDPSQVDFNGSINVMVTRKPDSVDPASHRAVAAMPHRPVASVPQNKLSLTAVVSKPLESHPELNITTKQQNAARQMVLHAIEDELSRSGQDWGKPNIFIRLTPTQVLQVLSATDGLRVSEGRTLRDDRFELVLAFHTADGSSDSISIVADIKQKPRVLSAKYNIPRGSVITASDVEFLEVDDVRNGVTNPEIVIGKEARSDIRAGSSIKADAVVEPLMIRKGDLCNVVTRVGGTQVSVQCRSLKDGRLGDSITFESSDRRDPLYARVVGVKQAETGINTRRPPQRIPDATPSETGDAEFDMVSKPAPIQLDIPSPAKSFAVTDQKPLGLQRNTPGKASLKAR